MPIINISVKDKIATLDSCASIVCKNSDYMAHFTFDEDWNGYNVKLAKFIYNDKIIPRVFIGNDCAIPKLPNTYSCLIEIEAGDVKTSAPVHINCIPVGDNEELEETEEYKTSVINQVLELIKYGTITSATIVKTEFVGKDSNGGNVYKQIFDNGMESFFTAPKGDTVGVEFGETQGTAYEGNKGAKNSKDIINILNEILLIQGNITDNNSAISKLLLDVKNLTDRLNFIANSDDKTLDQLQEIVEFAKNNKNLIDTLNKIVDLDDIPENHIVMVDKDKKLVDSNIKAQDVADKDYVNETADGKVNDFISKIDWYATDSYLTLDLMNMVTFEKISGVYGASLPIDYSTMAKYEGMTVNVILNGVKYPSIVKSGVLGGPSFKFLAIGNLGLISSEELNISFENTGEPFLFLRQEQSPTDMAIRSVIEPKTFVLEMPIITQIFNDTANEQSYELSNVDLKIGDKLIFYIDGVKYERNVTTFIQEGVAVVGAYVYLDESGDVNSAVGVAFAEGSWFLAVNENVIGKTISIDLIRGIQVIPEKYLPDLPDLKTNERTGWSIGFTDDDTAVFMSSAHNGDAYGIQGGWIVANGQLAFPYLFEGTSNKPLSYEDIFYLNAGGTTLFDKNTNGMLVGGSFGRNILSFIDHYIPFYMRERLMELGDVIENQTPPEVVTISGDGIMVGDPMGIEEIIDNMWYGNNYHRTVYSKGKIINWHRTAEPYEDNRYTLNIPDKNGTIALTEDIDSAIGEISTALDELHNYAQNLASGVSE